MTGGVWQILSQALGNLKNLHFNNCTFWPIFELKKYREVIFHERKIKEKLSSGLENDMRQFFNGALENFKIGIIYEILLSEVENLWA